MVLDARQVWVELNFVRELVLNGLLHIWFDLRAFFLAFRDKLRHAVVGSDKDVDSTFQQLSLHFLVVALVCLTAKFKLEPFDLTDKVAFFICVREQKSFILTYLTLQEIGLAANMVNLVAHALFRSHVSCHQFNLFGLYSLQRLFVHVWMSVQIDG